MKRRIQFATAAVAIAGFGVLAGCRDTSPPTTSETTTTGVEVERRQAEIPSLVGQVNTTAVIATEGAAIDTAAASQPATTSPSHHDETIGDVDRLDANRPVGGTPGSGH
jgi:hypothetical protein